MVFFLNLVISILYCDYISRREDIYGLYPRFILFLPLLIGWTLICGSQYYVGTDYPSYIDFFNGLQLERLARSGELGFIFLIRILNFIGIKGQGIYFIIYFISFVFLFNILNLVNIRYWGLFILLYIVSSTIFNNQLNIVRQCFAIYIGSYSAVLLYKKHIIQGLLLVLLATSFHLTSILFIVFLLFRNRMSKPLSANTLVIILSIGIVFGDFIIKYLIDNLTTVLPTNYAWHIISGNITEVEGLQKISKYIYVPFFYLAIMSSPNFCLTRIQRWLFNWGILGFTVRMLVMNLQIINRISYMFLIFSIFPLLYYFIFLIQKGKSKTLYCLYGILIMFYAVKVIIKPINEYAYDSIFFRLL